MCHNVSPNQKETDTQHLPAAPRWTLEKQLPSSSMFRVLNLLLQLDDFTLCERRISAKASPALQANSKPSMEPRVAMVLMFGNWLNLDLRKPLLLLTSGHLARMLLQR